MNQLGLLAIVIAGLGLIPVAYFVYSRVLRKRHKIDFNHGNVTLARVVSLNPSHNEKLALVTCGLTFVNSGPDPVTLKEVLLRYRFGRHRFGRKREADLAAVPTGRVEGKQAVVMANASDRVVIAWTNLRDTLLQRRVLQPGETINGSGIFFLETPVDRYREVSRCVLIVRDYSGGQSRHSLSVEPGWYKGMEKGIALVDAPVREDQGIVSWEGITIAKGSA